MFIDVADGKLFALRHGDRTKQTIVGIGGFVASGELWAEPFAQLSARWSTIAYDHRGIGASVAATSSITLDNLVSDLFAVMNAYGVERGVIASESSGALTALTAALAQPERVSHLIIVAGAYFMEPSSGPGAAQFHQHLVTSYEEWVAQFIEDSTPEPDSDHYKAWGRKVFDRATPEDAVASLKAVEGVDLGDPWPPGFGCAAPGRQAAGCVHPNVGVEDPRRRRPRTTDHAPEGGCRRNCGLLDDAPIEHSPDPTAGSA